MNKTFTHLPTFKTQTTLTTPFNSSFLLVQTGKILYIKQERKNPLSFIARSKANTKLKISVLFYIRIHSDSMFYVLQYFLTFSFFFFPCILCHCPLSQCAILFSINIILIMIHISNTYIIQRVPFHSFEHLQHPHSWEYLACKSSFSNISFVLFVSF